MVVSNSPHSKLPPIRWLRRIVLGGLIVVLAAGAWLFSRHPSHDRTWVPEHARLPRVVIDQGRATISDVRDFPPDMPGAAATARYVTQSYDLDAVESAWFVLVPFSQAWRGPAHSFVSFGFRDGRYVAISIEARREEGETYGLVAGLMRNFELIFVVGEERDLIGRRVAQSNDDVYLYEIKAPRAALRAAFLGILNRVEHLRERPEFYDTLINNCTSNLIDQVNAIRPQAIGWTWKRLVPGYADDLALELGLLDTTLTLKDARPHFRINDRATRALQAVDFSRAIRRQE